MYRRSRRWPIRRSNAPDRVRGRVIARRVRALRRRGDDRRCADRCRPACCSVSAIALLFAAVLLLGPVMAKPIARVLGAPVQRLRGVTGAMARGNVQRNPKRTARTAAPVLDRRRSGDRCVGVRRVDQGATAPDDRVDLRRRLRDQHQQRRSAQLQPELHRPTQHDPGGRHGHGPRVRADRRRRRASVPVARPSTRRLPPDC